MHFLSLRRCIAATAVIAAVGLAGPAGASDAKTLQKLYDDFAKAYGTLGKEGKGIDGLEDAQAQMLERFREFMSPTLTAALTAQLKSNLVTTYDGLAGPKRIKDALTAQLTAIDKEIGRINKLKGTLNGTKSSLDGKINGLGNEKKKWAGEVNRLIREINALGGRAFLQDELPKYAAYPGRSHATIFRKARRLSGQGYLQVAIGKKPPSLPGKRGGGGGPSDVAKRASSDGFHGVADNLDNSGFDALKSISGGNFRTGPRALSAPDDLRRTGLDIFRINMPPPPVISNLPKPDTAAGRIPGLRKQLAVARENVVAVNGRIGELGAEMGILDVNVGDLDREVEGLTARKKDLQAVMKGLSTAKFDKLNGKPLFRLNAVTWPGATADGVFKAGKAKVTSDFSVFESKAKVTMSWNFKDAKKSLSSFVTAIKGSTVYKREVGK